MSVQLSYQPNVEAVLSRLRQLYVDRSSQVVLATMAVPSQTLEQFAEEHESGMCAYPDPARRIDFWDAMLAERTAVEDDSIPNVYPSEMDQGLYGALLGAEPRFLAAAETGWISSMVAPFLEDLSQVEGLSFSSDHPWQKRYVRQLQVFVEGARGKFGVSHFILINGLNLIFELVGATQTYMELIERPDLVRRAIDLAHDLNVHVQQTFFEHVPLIAGGTCSFAGQWLPGRIITESVDPFHMTSVDYFEQWGRGVLERIYGEFDGGILHLHGNGRHLLEAVSSVHGLKALYLGDDHGYAQAFDVLRELRTRAGDLPLIVNVPCPQFTDTLAQHRLVGGVLYAVSDAPDFAAAHRTMEQVRRYEAD